jgi:hypothetical protein
MVSNLVFYQLALIALLWVFLMLSWVWPSEDVSEVLVCYSLRVYESPSNLQSHRVTS